MHLSRQTRTLCDCKQEYATHLIGDSLLGPVCWLSQQRQAHTQHDLQKMLVECSPEEKSIITQNTHDGPTLVWDGETVNMKD